MKTIYLFIGLVSFFLGSLVGDFTAHALDPQKGLSAVATLKAQRDNKSFINSLATLEEREKKDHVKYREESQAMSNFLSRRYGLFCNYQCYQPGDYNGQTFEQQIGPESISFTISPAIYYNQSITTKVINLAPTKSSHSYITLDDQSKGYRYIYTRQLEFGIGVDGNYQIPGTGGMSVSMGILPIFGSDAQVERYAKDKATLKKYDDEPLMAPYKASDLDSWESFDSFSYDAKGGIKFFASIGYGYFNVGFDWTNYETEGLPIPEDEKEENPEGEIEANGKWGISVMKLNDPNTRAQYAYVRFMQKELDSWTISAGNALFSLGHQSLDDVGIGFSLLFRLNNDLGIMDKDGRKAYELAIKGKLSKMKDLIGLDQGGLSVAHVDTFDSRKEGSLINVGIGLPIVFNYNYSEGNLDIESTITHDLKGAKSKANYSIYLEQDQNRGFINDQERELIAFYGSRHRVSSSGNNVDFGYFGEFVLGYEDLDTEKQELESFINKIVRRTGLNHFQSAKIPNTEENLGYTSLKAVIRLSEDTTRKLLNFLDPINSLEAHQTEALSSIRKYAQGTDIYDLCTSKEAITVNGITYSPGMDEPDKAQVRKECFSRVERRTKSAVADMMKAIKKMQVLKQHTAKDEIHKKFVSAYADFGEAMLTNPFTFNLGLALTGGDYQMQYLIEGERLSQYNMNAVISKKQFDRNNEKDSLTLGVHTRFF
jgi:hypothetical protein